LALGGRLAWDEDALMTQTQTRSDSQLKDAVVDELKWTPSVNDTHIGVAVDHGAVTLSGEVDSYPEKHNAENAAMRVRGVSAVAEALTVRSAWGAVSDADVAREASEALDRAIDVPDNTVKVVVHDHFVTLTGSTAWQYQREAAHRAVRYLKGVVGVMNSITIKPTVSTASLKGAISAALVRSARSEGKDITVTADSGDVTLEGTVHSPYERRQASAAAWSAPGVTGVRNRLVVI
jgi:osmotically-inducible protein OsmY